MRSATVEERFWAKVSKTAGCWLWTGSKDKKGYGQLRVGEVTSRAHRLAYEMTVGPIPDGLVIDHLCRTPGCVNPSHLEPVTSAENSKRGIPRNRLKTHCAKGHPYTPENTYRDPRGWRQCRACHRERDRQRWITERNSRPAKPRCTEHVPPGTAVEVREKRP